MKTVKEISNLTGISVRTLHYYDEIRLLRPTAKTEAGYRLYDDKALETLQQILFFREFDIPLKEIKALMDSPTLDTNRILQMQRRMLVIKRDRLERLIASIDSILKGENPMDFTIFNQTEIEALCQAAADHMPDFVRQSVLQEFGSLENWKQNYLDRASREDMQKGYQKMVQWYGSKDKAMNAMTNPPSQEVGAAFAKRVESIEQKLAAGRHLPVDSFEIRQIIGEYGFVMKRLYQVEREAELMCTVASSYRDPLSKTRLDAKYGEGSSDFFADAIEAFYLPR